VGDETPYWHRPLAQTWDDLASSPAGLSTNEAAARIERWGENAPRTQKARAWWIQLLSRFSNPLVLILLAASAVSIATGDRTSSSIVIAIVLMSVVLDFVQEHRAGRAVERLKQSVVVRATVLRDEKEVELPATSIVPGDVVRLSAGDLIPADGLVLESRDFFVNQAMLTGESYPVEKSGKALPDEGPVKFDLAGAMNAVFMGTSVISGSATALIVRTGDKTAFGGIAGSLAAPPPATAFTKGARQFGMMILKLTVLLVLFVVLVNAIFHRPLLESFLFAVALAVGLTPELLPMIVTVTLSRGAIRMAKKKVIVKRLSAIQDLGSMDVLLTDKTGTLTEAKIRMKRHVGVQGEDDAHVLELAYVNSFFESGLRSPLDRAILDDGSIDASGWKKIDEVPFDFERRRVSVLVERDGARTLIVKGAPEEIMRLSKAYPEKEAHEVLERFGCEGYRVIAVASRLVANDTSAVTAGDERELTLAGFVAFLDPPKESAKRALERLLASGVAVKVVSGDSEHVTCFVAQELGLSIDRVLLGEEVDRLDDRALEVRAEQASIFCRTTPVQKQRVLHALQRRGHTVGFLGDGINDAPSLHGADVGISVDGAVDVAKEAADLILLESDLGVLHEGVLEGRRTFANVMKYIMMGTSSNFGNMFSMAGATLALPFLPMLPVQIVLNNLLYDISELPIPMDDVDPETVAAPRRWDMGFIRNFMLVLGPLSSIFDVLTFVILLRMFDADEALFHTGWFIESLATQVLVIFIIRTRRSPLESRPARALVLTSLLVVSIAILIPFTPAGAYLGFVAPPPRFLLLLCGLTIVYLVAAEVAKRWFYRRFGAAHAPGESDRPVSDRRRRSAKRVRGSACLSAPTRRGRRDPE
jgi:Mg2+-importing ATPase